jgi:hypothetical protein
MAESEHQSLLENIRELKHREPFGPFQIVVASGDIENGENLVEMRTEFVYAYPVSDRFVLIRMNQIVAVERPGEKRRMCRRAS